MHAGNVLANRDVVGLNVQRCLGAVPDDGQEARLCY